MAVFYALERQQMHLIASGIDYDPLPESDSDSQVCHTYRTGEKITTLTEENIRIASKLGFKTLQIPASDFYNHDLQLNGQADWQFLDDNLAMLARHDMQALVMADFHWIPPCLQDDPRGVPLRCLQHNQSIPFLSLWSPFIYEWIDQCVSALAAHLQSSPAKIFAVHAALYGEFGEAMFPAGAFDTFPHPDDPGRRQAFHNHRDFWCNDSFARADFVRLLQEQQKDSALSGQNNPDDPNLFPAAPEKGVFDQAWNHFVEWYHASMTNYAAKVAEIYHRYFPKQKRVIYLGGGHEPHTYGQDNTGLPKAMRSTGTIVRSTASASEPFRWQIRDEPGTLALAFQKNYSIVKRIATACKHYNVPLWLESPYPPALEKPALIARVFEAISCGVTGYFEWTRTLQREHSTYAKYLDLLRGEQPEVDIAIYFSTLSHRSNVGSLLPERFWNAAAAIRSTVDYDVVDDRLITDNILDNYKILIIPQIEFLKPDIFERFCDWTDKGGILVTGNSDAITSVDSLKENKRQRFDRLRQGSEERVLADDRPIAVRFSHGNGHAHFCSTETGADIDDTLISVLNDIIQNSPKMACSLSGQVCQYSRKNTIFVTAFTDNLLLANLSNKPFLRS